MLSIKNFFKIFICAFVFSTLSGYSLAGGHTSPNNLDNWDFDHDGNADALTDGLLLLRYAFGLTGDALVSNAIAEASPLTPLQVQENVAASTASFADIDNSGNVDALTDGLLLLRYLFGLTGDALLSSAVAENATRANANDIESYILSLMPSQTDLNDEQVTGGNSNSDDAIDESVNIVLNDEGEISGTADFYNSDFIKMNTFGAGQLIIEIVPDDNQSDIDCGLTQDIGPSSFSSNNFISDDTNTSINNDSSESNCNLTAQFTDDRDFYLFVDIADESVGSVSYTVNYSFLQLEPTEIGDACRIDEPYYPLPATYEYRKPEAGNSVEFDHLLYVVSNTGEVIEDDFKSNTIYYNISDIESIVPDATPSFIPSSDWGEVWSTDNLISALFIPESTITSNTTNFYLYPSDGSVKLIRSDSEVYSEYDSNKASWLWGSTMLPKLDTFTTFTYMSKNYELNQEWQRWVSDKNLSINDTSIVKTGIGCIETFILLRNETSVMEYDSYIYDLMDNGVKKFEIESTNYVHPTIGTVMSGDEIKGYPELNSSSPDAVGYRVKVISEINFYSELPDLIQR